MFVFLLVAAFKVGDEPERIVAAALMGMLIFSGINLILFDHSPLSTNIDLGFFIIDGLTAAVLIAVALKANRIYTLWMAGFQIIALLAHFARGLTEAISPIAYVILVVGPSYFQIIILTFGIWLHHRRVRRHGTYRPWRTSLPLSPETEPRN